MISSNSVSSFSHRKTSKPAKQRPVVQQRPSRLSKLPRAILALLASSVGEETTGQLAVTGTSTTALTDGGYVVIWSRVDGSISSRAFSPDGSGGFVAGDVAEVVGKSPDALGFPAHLLSGQMSAAVLPDQIPAEKLPAEERIPTGTVAYFNMTDCPVGWQVFNDATGRSIVGAGRYESTANDGREEVMDYNFRQTGGEVQHQLTVNELPSHSHSVSGQDNSALPQNNAVNEVANLQNHPGKFDRSTSSVGGDAAHNVLSPYIALKACIKIASPDESGES